MKTNHLFLAFVLFAALLLGGCAPVVQGSGNVVSEERPVSGFDQVALLGVGDVIITQGEAESLLIEAEDNLLPYITSEVRNGKLEIGYKPEMAFSFRPTRPIKFHVAMKTVTAVELSGSGNISAENLVADELKLTLSGSGNIHIDRLDAGALRSSLSGSGDLEVASISAKTVDTTLSGSGKCALSGQAADQSMRISGSGNYRAADLESRRASLTITGSGDVEAWVTEKLDVSVTGSGDIRYYGAPDISEHITGSGSLSGLGAH